MLQPPIGFRSAASICSQPAQPAQAAQAFRAAIAADPAHVEAHHGLVRALRDAGRLEQAGRCGAGA